MHRRRGYIRRGLAGMGIIFDVPDYLDDEWDLVKDYYVDYYALPTVAALA